jgi:hypothetical protein
MLVALRGFMLDVLEFWVEVCSATGSWKLDGKIDVSVTSFCEMGKCAALLRSSR